jgi:hypothetical protein
MIESIQTQQVFTKSFKRYGKVYPAQPTKYQVALKRNSYIAILENGIETASFNIGDTAEYGSYNLRYLGKIIQISDKGVTIEEPYKMYGKDHGRRHRLGLNEFCWRNSGFDLGAAVKFNQEEMLYI